MNAGSPPVYGFRLVMRRKIKDSDPLTSSAGWAGQSYHNEYVSPIASEQCVWGPDGIPDPFCCLKTSTADFRGAAYAGHIRPEPGCTCGFYAFYSLRDASDAGWPYSNKLLVLVKGSGRVILHDKGFRAERMRIMAITLPDPDSWFTRFLTDYRRFIFGLEGGLGYEYNLREAREYFDDVIPVLSAMQAEEIVTERMQPIQHTLHQPGIIRLALSLFHRSG
jgi:hypothetical protein